MPDETSTRRFRHRADVFALAAFLLIAGAVLGHRFLNDQWLTEYDIMTYFLPWYGLLGDRLGEFDIPGWTPWFSSGSPVAGDPSGGWMYLPVMLPFSLLGVAAAFKTMILIQVLIDGISTYILSRMLNFGPLAALMSTTAFVFGPFLAGQTSYGTVAGQVSTWIPVALIGIEGSLRASHLLYRAVWWSLSGIAISQIAVSWPGQGLINALLIIAAWVVYRTLVSPPDPDPGWRRRFMLCFTTGPAVLGIGLLLGAAGLLPRLAISAVSNIPNGDYSNIAGGDYLVTPHTFVSLLRDTLIDDTHFRPVALSAPVVVLGIIAVLIGRQRYAVPFFAFITIFAAIMSTGDTPLHQVMYLFPGFESIHTHSPRRLLWVCFLAPAMLSGAGLQALQDWQPRRWTWPVLLIPFPAIVAAAVVLHAHDEWIGWWVPGIAVIATGLAFVIAASRPGDGRDRPGNAGRIAAVAMIVLTLIFPVVKDIVAPPDAPDERLAEVDRRRASQCIDTYLARTDPGGAGAFLQGQQSPEDPFRFVGYAGRDPSTDDESYASSRCEPAVLAVAMNGRAARLELETIQGYNPLHLGVYHEYFDVMNGGPQDYHWLDPYPGVLESSPLLNMLNVRYIVVARDLPADRDNTQAIADGRVEVFRNDEVVIYENPDAFPRAWIVHDVRPNDDGEGLRQIAGGNVDGREIAFVDGPLPELAPPDGATSVGTEQVVITDRSGDALTAVARANTPGLIVFSEIFEEGWVAYVAGERVDVVRTNHALRGVPVATGEHTVELRYEPTQLRIGLWITAATSAAIVGIVGLALRHRALTADDPA